MKTRNVAIGSAILAGTLLAGLAIALLKPAPAPAPAPNAGPAEDAGLFCKEHGVPEKYCTICHEELAKTLLLCKEHGGLPEAICTLCHPEAEGKYGLVMCPKGHGLPRDFCEKCKPPGSASTTGPGDGWCAAHNQPEATCDLCQRGEGQPGQACRKPLATIRLASARLAGRVGIETAAVTQEDHAHTLTANAEAAYDGNRYADVAPRVAGFLREVRVDLGRAVKRGDVLAVVDSAEVSGVKAQYLTATAAVGLARATYERTRSLAETRSVAGKTELESLTALNQARTAAVDAEQKLRNFGFDDAKLARIVETNDATPLLDVVAPLDGVVVARHAVRGEPIQATTAIFAVADTSRVWLWIDVYEADIAGVKPGQPVSFAISGDAATVAAGAINWVDTEVNPRTRTTRVRAELANPDGRLRANQFGRAEIRVGDEHRAVIVPRAAVQRNDGAEVVFLPEKEGGVYRPQRVVTRPTDRPEALEVAWGLEPGQRVVTRGAFLLKTELMKGAIGAGCCK